MAVSSKVHVVPKLILASASPRRREILKAAGIDFEILPVSVSELQKEGESARRFVSRMATEKAEAALAELRKSPRKFPAMARAIAVVAILGADTVVVIDHQTLGKPASPEDACRMLRLLSGRTHQVLTGLCILYSAAGRTLWQSPCHRNVRVASTTVKFRRLTRSEIETYVATREPFDKAGGYAIQGRASKFVEWIDGCYFNVVGLPVALLDRMLKEVRSVAGDVGAK